MTSGKFYRKLLIFPWNIGLSCNFSLKPINWLITYQGYSLFHYRWIKMNSRLIHNPSLIHFSLFINYKSPEWSPINHYMYVYVNTYTSYIHSYIFYCWWITCSLLLIYHYIKSRLLMFHTYISLPEVNHSTIDSIITYIYIVYCW